jgi:hypothetical protein
MVDSNNKNNAAQWNAEVRAASQRGTGLSGAPLDCSVPLEDKGANGQLLQNPNSWVTWRRTEHCTLPVRWRTGLSGAPIDSSLPTATLVVEGYKYPNHHNFKHPSFLKTTFNTRALAFTPRHNTKDQILFESQIHSKHLVAWERVRFLCSFEFLSLGLAFFFSFSYSQVLCKQGKRHQVCGGPCGVVGGLHLLKVLKNMTNMFSIIVYCHRKLWL